jgi:HK97 family phage prohead protease
MKRPNYDGVLTKADAPRPFTKADGEKGELAGYASKFWEVDSYGECTAPGCFAKSITDRGPKAERNRIHLRYEHYVTVGKHTALEEDETGLKIEGFVSDDGMDGSRLRAHLRDGLQYGLSIGFRKIRSRPGTPEDPFDLSQAPAWLTTEFDPAMVIVLEEVKLLENSAVSFPAVDTALVDEYRSAENGLAAIDNLLHALKAGTLRPEHKTRLERLAVDLPAALAPPSDPEETRRTTDSEFDMALLELAVSVSKYAIHGRAA